MSSEPSSSGAISVTSAAVDDITQNLATPEKVTFSSNAETAINESAQPTQPAASNDIITQLENKVASFWSSDKEGVTGESILQQKNDILSQIGAVKESLVANETLHSNVQIPETKLKELTEKVKNADFGFSFDEVSIQANKALDILDSKLEIVEQQATKFVSLLTSFFSGMVAVSAPESNDVLETPKDSDRTDRAYSGILCSAYGNTRYDSDLHKLHTTESYYLDDADAEDLDVDVLSKTDEIAALLAKYPDTLDPLMSRLVPVKITYQRFWNRYFAHELRLRQLEESRKSLLSPPQKSSAVPKSFPSAEIPADTEDGEDDDDFAWDDDDEGTV